MDIKVKAKQSFMHGRFNLKKGQVVDMPEATAKELEKAGLVGPAGKESAAESVKTVKPVTTRALQKKEKPSAEAATQAALAQTDPAAGTSGADVCTNDASQINQSDASE